MVTFTDSSNLTANERGFPEVPISSCSSVNMPTGRTCSRAPRLSCGSNTTGTNHPWSPPDQLQRFPGRGQIARLGSRKGVHSSGPCSVLLEEDCWEHLSLAAIPGDGCYAFTSSILLPYDSAPWGSSTWGNQPKTCLWKGEGSDWHTWTCTPCTGGESAHRVPLSIRSCIKSLSCTQPELVKRTPLRSQSPEFWPMCLCREVV